MRAIPADPTTRSHRSCQTEDEGAFLQRASFGGALRFAKKRDPGQTIVTILCDSD